MLYKKLTEEEEKRKRKRPRRGRGRGRRGRRGKERERWEGEEKEKKRNESVCLAYFHDSWSKLTNKSSGSPFPGTRPMCTNNTNLDSTRGSCSYHTEEDVLL